MERTLWNIITSSKLKTFFSLILFMVSLSAHSQDRYFAQTYTADILPKGAIDIELWHTSRIGRVHQYYNAIDQRMEIEVGLGGKVQTAFYFNRFQETVSKDSGDISSKTELGFSNEWKVLISKSGAKINAALYAEIGLKGDEVEWEGKLILDRAIGKKNLLAFNLVAEVEQEIVQKDGRYRLTTSQTPINLLFGYLYYLQPGLGIGAEIKNTNGIVKGNWQHSILFAGPTINYRTNRWFFIVNVLPQLVNFRKSAFAPGNKVLDVHERFEGRIVLGFSL